MRAAREYNEITNKVADRIRELADHIKSFNEWLHVRSSCDTDEFELLDKVTSDFYRSHECVDICSGYNKVSLIFNDDEFGEDWIAKFPKNVTPKEQLAGGRWTACDREAEFYDCATQENLQNYFAECWSTTFMLDDEEIPIYIMRRAVIDEDEVYYLSDMGEDYTGCEDSTWEAFENCYNAEVRSTLEWFCQRLSINDLHEGNVGFIDGKLVCIDYSGYVSGEEDGYYEW